MNTKRTKGYRIDQEQFYTGTILRRVAETNENQTRTVYRVIRIEDKATMSSWYDLEAAIEHCDELNKDCKWLQELLAEQAEND